MAPRSAQRPIVRLPGVGPKLAYAGRRFHAWWEGYGFDPRLERQSVLLQHSRSDRTLATQTDQADFVAEAIWGHGRTEPGSPAWTLHLARSLMIETRAKVAVFGAGRGGPLLDLKTGTRWHVSGYAKRASAVAGVKLIEYGRVRKKMSKATMDGGMIIFDANREADATTAFRLLNEMLVPGAKAVAVDFTVPRREIRLKGAFNNPWAGVARTTDDYQEAARAAGFDVTGEFDDTAIYLPLIAQGWAGWRTAWQILENVADNRQRSDLLTLLGRHADLWAERYEAMQSGLLQVSRFVMEKPRNGISD